jgi:hypothetical protein
LVYRFYKIFLFRFISIWSFCISNNYSILRNKISTYIYVF